MSNALAISGVTAALQYFLSLTFNNPSSPLGGVTVSALAPDIVQTALGGQNAGLQVNLFLHQVTHNAAYRNADLPSLDADGRSQLSNPPLALDLHYLLTAYAGADTEAEALLGFGILMLFQTPILPRDQLRFALNHLPNSNPLQAVLGASGLADQIEMIKITPSVLNKEEMAWLWTALKADYRPTYPFQVSVVLIQPPVTTFSSLPVLSRNIGAQGAGPPPQILSVQAANGQTAAAPGDKVTVNGISLRGASLVALAYPRLGVQYKPFPPDTVTDTSIVFTLPDDATRLPAGVYNLALQFTVGTAVVASSNIVTMGIAPKIVLPITAVNNPPDGTLVTVKCDPQLLPNQTVSLALGGIAEPAVQFEAPTAAPTFQFPTLAPGSYLARLQVDGVQSPVDVDWNAKPPAFLGPRLTI